MNTLTINNQRLKNKIIFHIAALSVVYIIPTLSHTFAFPFYYFEPMRIVIVVSLLYFNRTDAFILAFTLPLFSFFTSGHPVLLKAVLICTELIINVFLFYFIMQKSGKPVIAIFLSIIAAKVFYYVIKYFLIYYGLLQTSFISTPLAIQFAVLLLLTGYTFLKLKSRTNH